MVQYWLNAIILRVVVPVTFTACVVWRPAGLSLIYLLLMLLSPLVPIPTHETMNGATGRFFKGSIALCFINALLQLAFQIVIVVLPSIHKEFLINCGFFEEIFRHIGLVRLEQATIWEILYWILPEIIALPMIIITYCICRRFTREAPLDPEATTRRSAPASASKIIEDANSKIIKFFGSIGTYIVLASLCLVSSLDPSFEGAFYFVVFLASATWWGCHKELQRGFAIICRFVMLVVVCHIASLMAYQNQWPQEFVGVNSTWSRYFALEAYYSTDCSDPRDVFSLEDSSWTRYGYALRLFWLYFVLALESQYLLNKPNYDEEDTERISEKLKKLDTTLIRHISIRRRTPSQRWQSARQRARKPSTISPPIQPDERTPLIRFGSGRTGLLQDSTGSVTVDVPPEDTIQMHSLGEDLPEDNPSPVEHVIMAVYSIFQLIVSSSYLATNIIMMTWSIMYHSWTTFVFLLWALILWMVPDKRASMMKCSPFIVFYGTILTIGGYVYSLNLTESELPTNFWDIELSEIGFSKPSEQRTWHLVIQSGFMTMFWITMRQYMAERKKNQRSSALRDMAAPLHLSVSAATSSVQHDSVEIKSQFMKDVGKIIKQLLTKFWIVVVAIMLFTSGITGEEMTVFRIIYMSLFLIFVTTFQISWSVWRRMMYMFWITVIAYSVMMLILVYTYQFNNFPEYWTKYLLIDEDLQNDIGLEKYETKDLFVRLLTPTFFVIITVLQMHYFHKDFLEETNMNKINVETASKRNSIDQRPSIAPIVSTLDVLLADDEDQSTTYTLKQLKQMSKLERIALFHRTMSHMKSFYNYIWLILEIHMQKIIFISLMLLCINDVCAINLAFIIAVVVTMNLRRSLQIVAINSIAFAIAVLMVTKMLYQIKYIKHDEWNVNCTSENETKTYNTAEWIGMKKAEQGELPNLLKGYILIVALTTLRAVIMVRQCFYRFGRGEPLETPQVMFPNIKRSDADRGISYCLKFLLNYGFYKFGFELCLMSIVTLIGIRLDFFSVLYGLWLLILFAKKRKHVARIWPLFKIFVIILLPLQYAIVVAPPTWLCIDYPWNNVTILKQLKDWLYLPDPNKPPNPQVLICDFFLLLMVIRQSLVFKIEAKNITDEQNLIAGHNYSVYQDMEKPNFVNPVKDYVSHIRCWLDVIKRGFMMSFMWITLSMMFLAGTKRTNLFSLGYLIGAFVFLWQGSDFYLRPVKTILKWWNILLGYNVCVIFAKALFQGFGYVLTMQWKESCMFIQLFGIGVGVCNDPTTDNGMIWDVFCFACLIIMKRIFKSYYFFHIVDETKAMSILASRGAELLEDLHRKRIDYQENVEKNVLEKLKFKMDKIKADQQRIQGPSYREPATHKVATVKIEIIKKYEKKYPPYSLHAIIDNKGVAPLAITSSMTSCISSGHTPPQGYRTPVDEDDTRSDAQNNKDTGDDPSSMTTKAASLLQAPSPNSAILTVSLEGYLEPTRISFGSPPSSDLNPRGISLDETFPVFSPPPHDSLLSSERFCVPGDQVRRDRRQSSFAGTTWISDNPTPRQSVVSFTSRSPRSHHTYTLFSRDRPMYRRKAPEFNRQAVRSGDYYMFDDYEDEDLTDLLPDPEGEYQEEERRRRQQYQRGRRMTVSELMTTLIKTDIEIATHVAMFGGTQKDALRLRRQSAPLTRKKSSVSHLSARSASDTATTDADRTSLRFINEDDVEREIHQEDLSGSTISSDEAKRPDQEGIDDTRTEPTRNISLLTYFKFAIQFINSAMVSATRYLNKFSRDYRYIRKVLAKEKKNLKTKPDFRMGMRLGINQIWQPIPLIQQRSDTERSTDETTDSEGSNQPKDPDMRKRSSLMVPQIRILAPSLERGLDASSSSSIVSRPAVAAQIEEDQQPELSEVDQPPIIQLLASIWFGILAHSTFMCYFMIFLHQIKNASLLSTPLPLMVFFWGSLTVPRPSKTFWVTVIAYTEAIVIVKSIFQLDQIPWTTAISSRPLNLPRILGIEKQSDYAFWDLLLLLMVFFHRYMLKALGQWTSPYNTRKIIPSKVTLSSTKSTVEPNGQPEATRYQWQNEEQVRDLPQSSSRDLTGSSDQPTVQNEQPETQSHANNQKENNEQEEKVVINDEEINPCDENFSTAVQFTAMKYLEPAKIFLENILSTDGKEKTNVYAYMFLCDFFNFLLLIFGFSAFGTQQEDGGVTAYFQENRVPMPFLLMLLLQFALIVIDRALYLRKSTGGKLVFQYFLIFGVHIWMFLILPYVTEKAFNASWAPPIWYMVKCFYLLFAAYQLRLGYPTRILGNFLCKNYSMINYSLFKVFMFIPFLFELRAVMDWIWTDTSMTIMDWFKMEDIFASIYQIKCMRGVESDYPQPRGIKKSQISKYITGGGALFLIIGLIWFPLLIFALGGTVGDPNPPYDVSLSIKLGSHEPIYTMSSQDSAIVNYTEKDFTDLTNIYLGYRYRSAMTFLENYAAADVSAVRMSNSSRRLWGISPPDKARLRQELEKNTTMQIHIEWSVSRRTHVKELSDTTVKTRQIEFPAYVDGILNPDRQNLIKILDNNPDPSVVNTTIVLQNVFPKFLKVTNQNVDPVPQLMHTDYTKTFDSSKDVYRNVTLQLSSIESPLQQWWMVSEKCDDVTHDSLLNRVPLNDCESWIMMFLFNDRTFPSGLSFISGFGILGLYTTAVILVSQMMRRVVSEMAPKIMFDDMPYVDRILRLCLDIYLVRESGELCLEEDLFAKLIFLYRSPETLIRWTRPPESGNSADRGDPDGHGDADDEDDHDDSIDDQRE